MPVLIFLIVVNVGIYVLMATRIGAPGFTARELLAWGGDLGALSLHGQPWRLLTANYLHASLTHIGGNMLLLLVTGSYVEPKVGSVRMLAAYTVCGLAGSLMSAWGHPNVVAVGASGAIAGLLGLIVVFYASGRHPEINGSWVVQTVGLNALYSFAPNVDWLAHLGGFVAGLACGAVLLALPSRAQDGGWD